MGRELKDTQLSAEFAAGLAYASAFARLATGRKKPGHAGGAAAAVTGTGGKALVSTQRPIRNDEAQGGVDDGVVVPGFTAAELDDPWAALRKREEGALAGVLGVEEEQGGNDPRRLFPELQPCEQVFFFCVDGVGWMLLV